MIKEIIYGLDDMLIFKLYNGDQFISNKDWDWLIKDFGWKKAEYIMIGDEFIDEIKTI